MKKITFITIILAALALLLTGCGQPTVGNRVVAGSDVQTFTYAYITLGGEKLVQGFITQWWGYNNSDKIQVMIDGKYYLTHCSNVVMVADPSQGNLGHGVNLWGEE